MSDVRMPATATATVKLLPVHNRTPSVIRIATGDEEEDIVRICKELHAENGKFFAASDEKIRFNLARAFNKKGAMLPAIGPKGAIEALGYVSIEQFAWSDDWHLSEWFNYVKPDFRKSQHAKALLRWEMGASDQMGIPLWVGVVSDIRLAAKLRLYRRVFGVAALPFKLPAGVDLDAFLASCGCAGAYFCYEPKTRYSDRVAAAEGTAPH